MAGLYIHIPFCKTRCGYCDFHTSTGLNLMRPLVSAIIKEIKTRSHFSESEMLHTVYLGGGTPSLLPDDLLNDLFETIYSEFNISDTAEITIEANPDDLTSDKIKFFRSLPVNRLSMGVQSLIDGELKFMNRRHNAQQAIDAIENAYNSGFENLTIDLIYGIPAQTMKSWAYTLDRALKLPVKHLSSYSLMYEKGTLFYNLVKNNRMQPMADESVLEMFALLIDTTNKAGFQQYEISNFSIPGWESRHNSSYWNGSIYRGVGPSAHSYNGKTRQWNIADNAAYIKAINNHESCFEEEILDIDTQYNDYIITRMRTMKGCNLSELLELFGREKHDYFVKNAQKFIQSGNLNVDNHIIRLNRSGIFISDHIMSDLMFV
ncbi:radical SAM family heme chaperone HemW [Saccharicrinis sp. FJH54]|uniref:radical SAM family heme chaperone HemW n=1 Tax=Saccharicrinis sp. FJH54 TaxID=3344665 RepID=UPI0035D441F0